MRNLPSVSLHGQAIGVEAAVSVFIGGHELGPATWRAYDRRRRRVDARRGRASTTVERAQSGVSLAISARRKVLTKMAKDAVDALNHADLLLAEILECMGSIAVRNRDSISGGWINSPYSRQASERRAAHDRRRASGRS